MSLLVSIIFNAVSLSLQDLDNFRRPLYIANADVCNSDQISFSGVEVMSSTTLGFTDALICCLSTLFSSAAWLWSVFNGTTDVHSVSVLTKALQDFFILFHFFNPFFLNYQRDMYSSNKTDTYFPSLFVSLKSIFSH